MTDSLFFVASKVFWLIARPESILVILVLVAGLFRWRWPALIAGLCMLMIGALPISDWLLRPLESRYPGNPDVEAASGVIVLGGASQAGISRSWDTIAMNEHGERFLVAMALMHKRPDLTGVFTGGSGSLRRDLPGESASARQVMLSTGLDPARLQIESESRTTWENAVFTKQMLGDDADKPWVLITSAWHMPRSVAVFCAAGWKQIIPYPAGYLSVKDRKWPDWSLANRLLHVNLAVKEWIGLVAYRQSGRAGDDDCLYLEGTQND